jgi:hypothetical protein
LRAPPSGFCDDELAGAGRERQRSSVPPSHGFRQAAEWVANGKLSHHLRSQSLTKLQAKSKLIPYKKRYVAILRGFEAGLESWARYPCALTFERTEGADSIAPELWAGYVRVMRAYGIRLQSLLSRKYWVGPHGFSGRWSFSGDFLYMVGGHLNGSLGS